MATIGEPQSYGLSVRNFSYSSKTLMLLLRQGLQEISALGAQDLLLWRGLLIPTVIFQYLLTKIDS